MTDPCEPRQRVSGVGARTHIMKMTPPLLLASAVFLVCAIATTPINGYFLRDEPILSSSSAAAFVPNSYIERRPRPHNTQIPIESSHRLQHLSMSSENSSNDQNNQSDGDTTNNDNDDTLSKSENDILSWRLAKARLEEANKPAFLTRKPLKLSYAVSQKWIRNNWAPTTQEEFEDLVENGNLRTPYISKRPDEYYGERGEWISWDHYLLGDCSNVTDSGGGHEVLKWQ
mmetsp:Transcript_20503/g.44499  ORF Transcript_20503/g.44499 Transcript_20503/m.44499 type:complete len:229 (+) Transcript_20503:109-795(+)